jgi:hypothetical protein
MVRAVEKVRERQARTIAALTSVGIPYALAGGNAAAAWVASVEPGADRTTPDVVIALRDRDSQAADAAMRAAGFLRIYPDRFDLFFDEAWPPSESSSRLVRKAVRFVFGSDLAETLEIADARVLSLDALVLSELDAGRTLNQVNIRDLIDANLVDESWCDRLPPVLADRLRELLADSDG